MNTKGNPMDRLRLAPPSPESFESYTIDMLPDAVMDICDSVIRASDCMPHALNNVLVLGLALLRGQAILPKRTFTKWVEACCPIGTQLRSAALRAAREYVTKHGVSLQTFGEVVRALQDESVPAPR